MLRQSLRRATAAALASSTVVAGRFVRAEEWPTRTPGASDEIWRPGQREVPIKPRWPGAPAIAGESAYTKAEVSRRDGSATSGGKVWVTYLDGVYDVTDFRHEHPGGHYIDQAAGGPVDSFWHYWTWHHHSSKVPPLLEKMRVGRLTDWDERTLELDDGSPYVDEPMRKTEGQRLFFNFPYCSETRPQYIAKSFFTHVDDFFVRNHCPVPHDEGDDHVVSFEYLRKGAEEPETVGELTVGQLRSRFACRKVNCVMQCSGNRASENLAVHGANGFTGTPFATITVGMLGNAQWNGVDLRSVLREIYPAHIFGKDIVTRHVHFEGKDGYGASAPLTRCVDPKYDALLCLGMNGGELPSDHGRPLRAILPGTTGARNVKWLTTVTIAEEESKQCWQTKYYKDGPPPSGQSLQELPVAQSVVLKTQKDGPRLIAEGVAYSGTGHGIATVEVSCDQGQTWHQATLLMDERSPDDANGDYGWIRWRFSMLAPDAEWVWCRACAREGKLQPEVGVRRNGYFYDGYHKKKVGIVYEWDEGAMPVNWKP